MPEGRVPARRTRAWCRIVRFRGTSGSPSREVRHRVDWTRYSYGRVPGVEGVYGKRLFASVIEDRCDDRVALGQRPTNLDLAVAPFITTSELENSSCARIATDRDPRTLAQCNVGGLRSLIRLDPGKEELRHLRGPLEDRGGKRLRSCAVILRILSEPSLTWRRISSSFARRFSAARSACVSTDRPARSAGC